MKDTGSGNVSIRDGHVDDRDEGTGGTSCTYTDTRVSRTKYVDQRESVNDTGTLDIPIDVGSGHEFELVRESNHNVNYDTTGNNIQAIMILQVIISCLIPVSMKKVKLIVNLKNERVTNWKRKQ